MVCERCNREYDVVFGAGRFCSKSCANTRTHSSTTKRNISTKLVGNVPWNSGKLKEYRRTCNTCGKEFVTYGWNRRKSCSVYCTTHAPGRDGGFRENSTRKIRSMYKGQWMDSGAERKFAELLDTNNIGWKKNTTEYFPYVDKEGKRRKYYPDFFLPDYNYWVEIKGTYYKNENDEIKLAAVGSNIELQYHNEIRLPRCVG